MSPATTSAPAEETLRGAVHPRVVWHKLGQVDTPDLFRRNSDGHLIDRIAPGLEPLFGFSTAFRMRVGAQCMFDGRNWWIASFTPCPSGERVLGAAMAPQGVPSHWVRPTALAEGVLAREEAPRVGRYTLCGPGLCGNREHLDDLTLFRDLSEVVYVQPDLSEVRDFFRSNPLVGGVVFVRGGLAGKVLARDA